MNLFCVRKGSTTVVAPPPRGGVGAAIAPLPSPLGEGSGRGRGGMAAL